MTTKMTGLDRAFLALRAAADQRIAGLDRLSALHARLAESEARTAAMKAADAAKWGKKFN